MKDLRQRLLDTVLEGDYCIGCGVCAAFDDTIVMTMDPFGKYVAQFKELTGSDEVNDSAQQVCPFAEGNSSEDDIAKELFGDEVTHNNQIGYHRAVYAGWAIEGDYRIGGSSGGLITWLLARLLDSGTLDHVVHVGAGSDLTAGAPMYEFSVSSTSEEIKHKAKSRYYPVEMSKVIRHIRSVPGRYVIVGLPCFVKAVRLASRLDSEFSERIVCCVGVVCGHLKSAGFAELIGWQAGVAPSQLKSVDFRFKIPDAPASKYGAKVCGVDSEGKEVSQIRPMSTMYGHNWGYGLFKYKACDYCDDVLAETADVSFGDAWLPQYVKDSQGTNVVVVRSKLIQKIFNEAVNEKQIHLERLDVEDVIQSQSAGLRHRRKGLAYRLSKKDEQGQWRPVKRVKANGSQLSPRERKIQDLREELAAQSHLEFKNAKDQNDLSLFMTSMRQVSNRYDALYQPPFLRRVVSKIRRIIKLR
jgi:coenzyme F420-reducing hydrogenase beta subunit